MADNGARFVTFEGPEGAGKTTQIGWLQEGLERSGQPCVVTREPGGTPLGEALRDLLLRRDAPSIGSDAELLLMFAARAEHLAVVIEPALAAGRWVLCDRFTDATYAYQGGGRGIEAPRIAALEQWVQGTRRPDVTIVLDVTVETGATRLKARGAPPDRFEKEGAAFYERVRRIYRARAEGARYELLDGSSPPETVFAEVCEALERRFPGLALTR